MQENIKQHENEYYQQNQLVDKILDSMPIGCYMLDNNQTVIYINETAADILNIKLDNILYQNVWEVLPEYVLTPFYIGLDNTIKKKLPFSYHHFSTKTPSWITLSTTPLLGGALVTLSETDPDLAIESPLPAERQRLKTIQKLGQIGYFEQDLASGDLYCTEQFYRIHGLTFIRESNPIEKFISCIHPDDQQNYRQQLNEGLARQKPFELTNRIIRKDGELRIIYRRTEFSSDAYGKANRVYGTIQDITKQTTTDLIVNNINEVCFQVDYNFYVTYANRKAYNTWQKEPADVIGKWIWDIFPEHLNSPFHETLLSALSTQKAECATALCPITKKWFNISANISRKGLIVLHLDITEQIQARQKEANSQQDLAFANEALREANQLVQAIFDTNLIGVAVLKAVRLESGDIRDFSVERINKEMEKETGRTDLVGKWYAAEYPGIKKAGIFDAMIKVLETGTPERIEYNYHHYGAKKHFLAMFTKMDDGLIASYLNVTSSKNAADQVAGINEQWQRELMIATISTQEKERKRIAEDLHNGIGQLLFAVKISVEQIKDNNPEPQTFYEAKKVTMQLLDDAMRESRRISHELSPAILDDLGLKEAVKEVCRQFSASINIGYTFKGINGQLSKYIEVSVYRIVQELVMNIAKHANATHGGVSILITDSYITLIVFDNGVGIHMQPSEMIGIGMKTIYDKVKLLKGKIDIDSTNGTRIKIEIPTDMGF